MRIRWPPSESHVVAGKGAPLSGWIGRDPTHHQEITVRARNLDGDTRWCRVAEGIAVLPGVSLVGGEVESDVDPRQIGVSRQGDAGHQFARREARNLWEPATADAFGHLNRVFERDP
ncbi:MAG: hypothetical protein DCC55_40450 [Chloroflexi bacterium]|nr:MAG: hypothetical protein DCC55_40450 [Chloroflexota bacterium]